MPFAHSPRPAPPLQRRLRMCQDPSLHNGSGRENGACPGLSSALAAKPDELLPRSPSDRLSDDHLGYLPPHQLAASLGVARTLVCFCAHSGIASASINQKQINWNKPPNPHSPIKAQHTLDEYSLTTSINRRPDAGKFCHASAIAAQVKFQRWPWKPNKTDLS
jgi:hypothetical protein